MDEVRLEVVVGEAAKVVVEVLRVANVDGISLGRPEMKMYSAAVKLLTKVFKNAAKPSKTE